MKTCTEDVNATRKTLSVIISADEVTEKERETVEELKKDAQIAGFRAGKAPEAILRRQYAKAIAEELERKIIRQAYEELQKPDEKGTSIDLLTIVDMQKGAIQSGTETTVTFTLDINPSFDLPNYKNIPVEVSQKEIQEEEIDTELQKMRDQQAQYLVIETPAKKGDYVQLCYKGVIDDQPLETLAPDLPLYGKQESIWCEAGTPKSLGMTHEEPPAAIIEGSIGMKAGDKRTISVDFPKDFETQALAGKKATYEVEVREVREKQLPEVDQAFLKGHKAKNLDDLRVEIKKRLENIKKHEQFTTKRSQVIEHIINLVDFPLPESTVASETQRLLQDRIHYELRQNTPKEDLTARQSELNEEARKAALKRVKLNLILKKIAASESIEVEEKDLHNAVVNQALMHSAKPRQYVKELSKDRERIALIQQEILFEKTLRFIVDHTDVTLKD